MQHIFGACNLRKLPPARDVIRVQMRVDHVSNIQIVFPGHTNVQVGIINGVAHGALRSASSTENIGSGDDGLPMEQLT